ncbi:hypothetical protein ACI5KZ_14675 [Xanthomarina sp. GH4-25]
MLCLLAYDFPAENPRTQTRYFPYMIRCTPFDKNSTSDIKIVNFIKNILTRKPKNPTEFVQKFIRDSKKSRVQLEIIRDNEIILQVDSLKFTQSWFKVFDVDKIKYQNGFVIFFIIDRNGIENNRAYIKYKKSDLKLIELDEKHGQTPIRTFAKFIAETDDSVLLGKEMKKIIDGVFDFTESDPQALFNLRYLK